MTNTPFLFYVLGVNGSSTMQAGCIASLTTNFWIEPQSLKRRRLHFLKADFFCIMVRSHSKRDIVTLFFAQPCLGNKRNNCSTCWIRTGNGACPEISNRSEHTVLDRVLLTS